MDITLQKKELRKRMMQERNALSAEYKSRFDASINLSLAGIVEERKCKVVHVYIPMLSEINISPFIQQLLRQNITVVSPKTLPGRKLENRILTSLDHLETGIMGTQHPASPDVYNGDMDLIVVPGMAFDESFFRLGYGGGYYDGFITSKPEAYKLGIFYPFQQVDAVPVEAHDIRLDAVLSNDVSML